MSDGGERAYVAGLTLLRASSPKRSCAHASPDANSTKRTSTPRSRGCASERAVDDRRTRSPARGRRSASSTAAAHASSARSKRSASRATWRAKAVAEVFADIDETALLERALDRRLRGTMALNDAAVVRRCTATCSPGFDSGRVIALLRRRAKQGSLNLIPDI